MADLLQAAGQALEARRDLLGWTAVGRRLRGEQLFSGRRAIEARRSIESDTVSLEVLCPSDGSAPPMCGAASVTLAAGEDPRPAIDFAVRAASRTRNPLYELPPPATMPDVPLDDPEISDLEETALGLHQRLLSGAAADSEARLALAEWFVEREEVRLVNSRGLEAHQTRSEISLEWIVLAGDGDGRVETTLDLTRRRLADVDVERLWSEVARQTADRQRAGPAPMYEGPVVLRGRALATFLHSGTIATLASGRARYAGFSHWEPGKSVFRGPVAGDPLTLWTSRMVPYGVHAGRFDSEGLPGQRVLLIRDGVLQTYSAGQRYATYLGVPATGAFGDIELPPGRTPQADLLADPHVEIIWWSWFSPNPTTGDFASEIRLGYVVDGDRRTPFTGGLLIGNVLDGLANVRWSAETGFFGDYAGPVTARFASFRVTPSRD